MTSQFDGVRCVLFDLDGTLIDSAPDLAMAANEMRVARGLPTLSLTAYRAHAGSGARGMLGVAFGVAPGDVSFDHLRQEWFSAYERRLTVLTRPFDGVPELLAELNHRALRWGVVTNKARRFTEPLVETVSLLQSAAVVVSGDSTPHPKPHPAPLLEAMRVVALNADECIYVGDDARDVAAGRAAGLRTVAASYGYLGFGANFRSWAADAVIYRPLDLLNLLPAA